MSNLPTPSQTAKEIGCGCPYPRDAGRCYALIYFNGLELPDYFDVWCDCFCHISNLSEADLQRIADSNKCTVDDLKKMRPNLPAV